MKNRALHLRKETLTELSPGELADVAGASGITYTYVLTGCMCSGMYPTLNDGCDVKIETTG